MATPFSKTQVTATGNIASSNETTPTFRDLAEALRNADMASLPVDARDDVIAIMTHLRGHLVSRFDALEVWQRQLSSREAEITAKLEAREERCARQEQELAQLEEFSHLFYSQRLRHSSHVHSYLPAGV